MRKTVQTLNGPKFVAGKSKTGKNSACSHPRKNYYANRVLMISLPKSTYGLDVLAYIGWRHEHEHKQLVEIQQELNQYGILINERNVGKLYRQFLALLGAMSEQTDQKLQETISEHGGLIFGLDGLQPEGHGTLLYVLYEVLSGTPVAAMQMEHATTKKLSEWLQAYQHYPALAIVSDGEDAIISAMKKTWPEAPHQRCQEHFLGNLAEGVLKHDTNLRKQMRQSLGGLPKVPQEPARPPPFCDQRAVTRLRIDGD
ncbi:transposase [bacterium]|nr:transposase [bacterium]